MNERPLYPLVGRAKSSNPEDINDRDVELSGTILKIWSVKVTVLPMIGRNGSAGRDAGSTGADIVHCVFDPSRTDPTRVIHRTVEPTEAW